MPPPNKPPPKTTGHVRIIAGKHRGRKLPVFDQAGLRPTGNRVRETLFNWLQHALPNACCADLFTGSGALAVEAASRGAAKVYALDTNPRTIAALTHISHEFSEPALQPYCQDARQWLQHVDDSLDIVFIDPPFGTDLLATSLELLANHRALHANSLIYIEAARSDHITLPAHWQWHRHQTTGDVQFGLACLR